MVAVALARRRAAVSCGLRSYMFHAGVVVGGHDALAPTTRVGQPYLYYKLVVATDAQMHEMLLSIAHTDAAWLPNFLLQILPCLGDATAQVHEYLARDARAAHSERMGSFGQTQVKLRGPPRFGNLVAMRPTGGSPRLPTRFAARPASRQHSEI